MVVAYGLILPPAILNAPRSGCLNLHASLLPRWRGAAPINRAIMAGDTETGVMVMQMDEGLDTGPVAMAEHVSIGRDMTAGELHDRLARLGADLMARALAALAKGALDTRAAIRRRRHLCHQDHQRRDAHRLVAPRCRSSQPHPRPLALSRRVVRDGVRRQEGARESACAPIASPPTVAPGAVLDTHFTVACGAGAVQLLELQRAGGKPLATGDFLRGLRERPKRLS